MLQMGEELMCYSSLFLLVLLATRSASIASVLTVSMYVFITMFRFAPLPAEQAGRVLRPRASIGGVLVVAHRGGSHDAPENTLAAIREASRNGAGAVQLDLSFTADGVAVLMHDETVDRTTNGSGPLSKLRFAQIRTLDAAARHRLKDKFSVETVPTLQEAVEECLRHQLTIFFGVRGDPEKAASALHHLYKKYPGLHNSSIVSSFEPKVIYKMRQTDPSVVTALSHQPWRLSQVGISTDQNRSRWGQIWSAILDVLLDWAHHHVLWRLCGTSAILVHKDSISLDYVQFWAQRGVEVVGWTVNSAVEKDFYQTVLKIGYLTECLLEDC
ncbi:glycerophosphodiester phosphodiesterase 1-like [Boleophthalmus pectinirostris]|uniref:glycerophosphodiester phosphodiesterase 1-like n=1 Tax=Boleophthalmus pectinirostris TaxID=150288 RepID=UPI00242BD239|nr:glycerophosphodiester phosphodiesterase 1-like [Boleophthalmus pectinirostris]